MTLKRISDFLELEENDQSPLAVRGKEAEGTELGHMVQRKLSLDSYAKESIDSFFESEDEEKLLNGSAKAKAKVEEEPFVELDSFTGRWDREAETATLSEVSLRAEAGQLVVVTGPVGSGKSSLIAAVLGELSPSSGAVRHHGSVAYVPQVSWTASVGRGETGR